MIETESEAVSLVKVTCIFSSVTARVDCVIIEIVVS